MSKRKLIHYLVGEDDGERQAACGRLPSPAVSTSVLVHTTCMDCIHVAVFHTTEVTSNTWNWTILLRNGTPVFGSEPHHLDTGVTPLYRIANKALFYGTDAVCVYVARSDGHFPMIWYRRQWIRVGRNFKVNGDYDDVQR